MIERSSARSFTQQIQLYVGLNQLPLPFVSAHCMSSSHCQFHITKDSNGLQVCIKHQLQNLGDYPLTTFSSCSTFLPRASYKEKKKTDPITKLQNHRLRCTTRPHRVLTIITGIYFLHCNLLY
jgi:hypothetical protein